MPAALAADESRPDLLGGGLPTSLRDAAHRADSYGFLLIVLAVLTWVVIPLGGANSATGVVSAAVTTWTILIALRASDSAPRRQMQAVGLATVGFLLVIVGTAESHETTEAVGRVLIVVPFFYAAGVVLRRVFSHRIVTTRTIAGAICVYLIVAVAFAQLYTGLDLVDGNSFAPGDEPLGAANMQYFSLVTIATLGYGDIAPVSRPARSMATLETVAGQIYLVVIVARLVSSFGQAKHVEPVADDAEPPPP